MQTKGVCIQYIQKTTWNYFDKYIIVHLIFSIQNKRGSISFVELKLNGDIGESYGILYVYKMQHVEADMDRHEEPHFWFWVDRDAEVLRLWTVVSICSLPWSYLPPPFCCYGFLKKTKRTIGMLFLLFLMFIQL